jgi:DNA-binding transcriptional LysR family regulator
MFDQLDKKKSSMGVRISVGVAVDIERPFVTDVLAKISKQYAKTDRPLLNLISLPSPQLLQLLKIGDLDVLLTTNSGVDHELEILEEFSLPVGAFVSKELLRDVKMGSFESLIRDKKLPIVLPSKLTNLRSEIDGYLIRKRLSPPCVFESNIISSVIRAASDAMGFTILPQVYVARELRSEKLVPISNKSLWKHRMTLLTSKQGLDEGRQKFADQLIQQLAIAADQETSLN